MRTKLVCDRHHLCRLYTLGIRRQGQVCVGPAHAVLPRSNRLWTLRSLGYQCRHDLWFRNIDGVAPCRFHCCRPCTLGPEALRCRREGDLMGLDADPAAEEDARWTVFRHIFGGLVDACGRAQFEFRRQGDPQLEAARSAASSRPPPCHMPCPACIHSTPPARSVPLTLSGSI